MARDEGLEELLHAQLAGTPGLSDKAMFGGQAWLVHGHMLCAASDKGMLIRVGDAREPWALDLPGIVPMIMGGCRRMRGWVRAGPDAFGDDDLRARLLGAALDLVRTLPPKSVAGQTAPRRARRQA